MGADNQPFLALLPYDIHLDLLIGVIVAGSNWQANVVVVDHRGLIALTVCGGLVMATGHRRVVRAVDGQPLAATDVLVHAVTGLASRHDNHLAPPSTPVRV